MKYLKYTRLLCMALLAMGFTACNDEDAYFEEDAQNSPIVVNKVYLQDVASSVTGREVTFARFRASLMTMEPSSVAGTLARVPPNLPIAVRHADAITIFFM